jgi:hypothetical protein
MLARGLGENQRRASCQKFGNRCSARSLVTHNHWRASVGAIRHAEGGGGYCPQMCAPAGNMYACCVRYVCQCSCWEWSNKLLSWFGLEATVDFIASRKLTMICDHLVLNFSFLAFLSLYFPFLFIYFSLSIWLVLSLSFLLPLFIFLFLSFYLCLSLLLPFFLPASFLLPFFVVSLCLLFCLFLFLTSFVCLLISLFPALSISLSFFLTSFFLLVFLFSLCLSFSLFFSCFLHFLLYFSLSACCSPYFILISYICPGCISI